MKYYPDRQNALKSSIILKPQLHIFLIVLIGILAYANTFHVPFILDDRTAIVENHVIKSIPGLLSEGFFYNPRRFVGYLTFAVNYKFGGLDVTGYHVVNLAIHLATAILVYLLCLITFRTPSMKNSSLSPFSLIIALSAALLFVSHPVQTQAITYISQRFASLATMFYLLSMTCYAKARLFQVSSGDAHNKKVLPLFLMSFVSLVLAMMTKEIAFTLPVMLVLYEFFFFPEVGRKRLLILLPFVLAIAIIPVMVLNSHVSLGTLLSDIDAKLNPASSLSSGTYFMTQLCVITTYIRLLIFPVNQNLDYAYPIYNSLSNPRVFCSFMFLSGLLAVAAISFIKSRRNTDPAIRIVSFGIFWFFIALSVESSIIPITDVIFEHRLYLPSVGAFIAFAAALALITRRYQGKAFGIIVLAAVIMLSVATWNRNHVWCDELTLWQDTVSKSPQKDRPHNNLGEAFQRKGRVTEAIQEVETALSLNPRNAEAYANLGAAFLDKGETEKALEHLETAVKLHPGHFSARYNLGLLLKKNELWGKASEQFLQAVKLNPDSAEAHNHLAVVYAERKLYDQARMYFKEAIRLAPEKAEYRKNLELLENIGSQN